MNNKQRKLKYIREKNGLRSGKNKLKGFFKVSEQLFLHPLELDNYIKLNISNIILKSKKKYKLNFIANDLVIGQHDDDFVKYLKTILVTFNVCN